MTNPKAGPLRMSMTPNGTMHLELSSVTMRALADVLMGFVDRPVVDMTHIQGAYQVSLEMSQTEAMQMAMARSGRGMRAAFAVAPSVGAPPSSDRAGAAGTPVASTPSGERGGISAAIERLGLKLDARNAPVDVIVVDHLEKVPTPN